MGFRCPKCKQDFGNDKSAFKKHLADEGFVHDMVSFGLTNFSDLFRMTGIYNIAASAEKENK